MDIYCGIDGGMNLAWYPDGTKSEESTGFTCPLNKWFGIAVSIEQEGTLNFQYREEFKDWQVMSEIFAGTVAFQESEDAFIHIGENFIGYINSFEIQMYNEPISIDQDAFESKML